MSVPNRIALSLPTPSGLVSDTIEMAQRAEAMGYDDLWLADAGGLDALTLSPMLLEKTRRVRLGIAVVPVYTRTPAVLASTFAVLGQAWPGRFIPGLGTSSHAIIENWHGLKLELPLTRMRETLALLRSILDGEKTAFSGQTLHSRGYRQAPVADLPIYLAALRPRMLELAAEMADGVIINLFPRSVLPKIMEHIAIGAERAGKNPEDVEIVTRNMTLVTADKAMGRQAFRAHFASYYATPVYNRFLAWAGFEEAAREIREGWASGDRERTAAALADELVDEIGIIGSASECQQLMRANARGGIKTNIVSCMHPDPDIYRATMDAFAPENFSW